MSTFNGRFPNIMIDMIDMIMMTLQCQHMGVGKGLIKIRKTRHNTSIKFWKKATRFPLLLIKESLGYWEVIAIICSVMEFLAARVRVLLRLGHFQAPVCPNVTISHRQKLINLCIESPQKHLISYSNKHIVCLRIKEDFVLSFAFTVPPSINTKFSC